MSRLISGALHGLSPSRWKTMMKHRCRQGCSTLSLPARKMAKFHGFINPEGIRNISTLLGTGALINVGGSWRMSYTVSHTKKYLAIPALNEMPPDDVGSAVQNIPCSSCKFRTSKKSSPPFVSPHIGRYDVSRYQHSLTYSTAHDDQSTQLMFATDPCT